MPASEASNALLLPVTGHELGHSLWRRDKCQDYFEPKINQAVIQAIKEPLRHEYNDQFKFFGISADHCDDYQNLWTWEKAADYCFRQVEEIFSDFVGLSLFGTSYLDSFEYLLSPALSTERDPEYPADATRMQYLEDNATSVGVRITGSYKTRFAEQKSPFHPKRNQNLQMILADSASKTLVASVADHVAMLCASRGCVQVGCSSARRSRDRRHSMQFSRWSSCRAYDRSRYNIKRGMDGLQEIGVDAERFRSRSHQDNKRTSFEEHRGLRN